MSTAQPDQEAQRLWDRVASTSDLIGRKVSDIARQRVSGEETRTDLLAAAEHLDQALFGLSRTAVREERTHSDSMAVPADDPRQADKPTPSERQRIIDSLNAATLEMELARSTVDALSSIASLKATDSLRDGSLYTLLASVDDALERVCGRIQAAFPARQTHAEVSHG